MSNTKKGIIIGYIIFVIPSLLYFVVNGYWWLFDGNNPIVPKMIAATWITAVGTFVSAMAWDLTK